MQRLSVTRAWNEAADFVRREAGVVFTLSFALMVLPILLMQASAPRVVPGQQPAAGPWLLWIVPLFVLAIVGAVAISALAAGSEVVVRRAVGRAFRRFPATALALFLMFLLLVLLTIPVLAIVQVDPAQPATMARLLVIQMLLALVIMARFFVIAPLSAAESIGAVALLRRSWRLVRGAFWRLFGLILIGTLLFLFLNVALLLAAGSVVTLVAGQPEPGSLSSFLLLLLNGALLTIFAAYATALAARVYVQLAGEGPTSGT